MKRKNVANRILTAVFGLFTVSAVLKYHYSGQLWIDMLFVVSEAALIGGIADWFAVTALFRRPLGFPWHTELIPRNRDRVIRSIVDMVEQDLLSAEAIKKRIADICFMNLFIDWVENKNGKTIVGGFIAKAAQHFLENINIVHISERAERIVRGFLQQEITLPKFESASQWALKQGRVEQLFLFMLDELSYVVAKQSTLEAIYQYLDDVKEKKTRSVAARLVLWLGEHTDSVNTRDAARALQQELSSLLMELRDPDHPVHVWAITRIAENIKGLAGNPAFHQAFSDWSANTIQQASLHELLARVVETAIDSLQTWTLTSGNKDARTYPPLMQWVFDQVESYWDGFKEDPDIHYWVERYAKKALFRLIDTEHHMIGSIVQDALEEFDNRDLSEFIEDKAGEDLQWIRINGSIVGGIVGLLLFILLRFVYDPIMVPLIRNWVL